MNKDYEELPPDLKKLADQYKKPYDKDYNYVHDFIMFLEWEKKEKGLIGYNFTSFNVDPNYNAYSALALHYSPDVEAVDMTGTFL